MVPVINYIVELTLGQEWVLTWPLTTLLFLQEYLRARYLSLVGLTRIINEPYLQRISDGLFFILVFLFTTLSLYFVAVGGLAAISLFVSLCYILLLIPYVKKWGEGSIA